MIDPSSGDWRHAVAGLPHRSVTRASVSVGVDGRLPVVVKTVGRDELVVHRLVNEAVPDAAPLLLSAEPLDADRFTIVLPEQGRDAIPAPATEPPGHATRAVLAAALVQLAAVHAAFLGSPDPARLGVGPPDAMAHPPEPVSDRLAGVIAEPGILADWERVERALPAHRHVLADEERWTLVHGDLHPGNVIRDDQGAVRIIDWGSACRQVPAWDLVTFDEPLLKVHARAFASAGGATDSSTFRRQLRSATVVRLHGRVAGLLQDPTDDVGRLLRATVIARCVDRVIAAHAAGRPLA